MQPRNGTYSLIPLILADLITPLVGVLYFKWDVRSLLFFYWTETAVIGFFTILKMLMAKEVDRPAGSEQKPATLAPVRWFMILFFPLHFGGFIWAHAYFLVMLTQPSERGSMGSDIQVIQSMLPMIQTALVVYLASHGVSFITNYLGKGEYARASIDQLFLQPYSRVMAMQAAVILGAFLAVGISTSYSLGIFTVLTITKTVISIQAHLKERYKFAQ